MRLPRRRAVMKWTGVGAIAMIVIAWGASYWVFFEVSRQRDDVLMCLQLCHGGVGIAKTTELVIPPFPQGWGARIESLETDATIDWIPRWSTWFAASIYQQRLTIPLYIPFTILALPTAWLFYRDRRSVRWSREGRCVGCGYDLSGASGKCPECGRGVT